MTDASSGNHGESAELRRIIAIAAASTPVRILVYLLVLVLAVFLLVGCVRHKPMISYQTSPDASAPMRVAVMPFSVADGVGRAAASVGESFAASLRSAGHHEVVLVPPAVAGTVAGTDALQRSIIRVEDLLAIRDHLRADAVIIGRIEQAATYDPVALGITAHLVSCTDGQVLWSATAHFDAARADVQDDLEEWHANHGGAATSSIAGWRLGLRSPQIFARYACDRLVETIPLRDEPKRLFTAEVAPTAPSARAEPIP